MISGLQEATSKHRLGEMEMRLLAYAQLYGRGTVTVGELGAPLGISRIQERNLWQRMANTGMAVRLKRGVYLVPQKMPAGGAWTPGDYAILNELMKASGNGTCQLCGPTAFYFYKFTDQVPNRTYVYCDRLSGERNIGGSEFVFIRTSRDRLGGTRPLRSTDGAEVAMPTRARTLMDAVYDWSRFNSLPEAYDWIRKACRQDERLRKELVELTIRYGNQGTIRRIGWVLESLGTRPALLQLLERRLKSRKSQIPLVPGRPRRGSVRRKWGVVENETSPLSTSPSSSIPRP